MDIDRSLQATGQSHIILKTAQNAYHHFFLEKFYADE